MAKTEAKNIKDRILSMGELAEKQDWLNSNAFKKPNWRNVGHKDELTFFHFSTQIARELVELIESDGIVNSWWKHHKDNDIDTFNVKIEAIDILHFHMACYIRSIVENNSNKLDIPKKAYDCFFGSDVAELASNTTVDDFPKLINNGELNYQEFTMLMNEFMATDQKVRSYPTESRLNVVSTIYYGVFQVLSTLLRMNSQEISAIFVAKYELNRFRQTDGYKNGSYVKVVDGVEDNQRLKPIVDQFLSDTTLTLGWVTKTTRDTFFKAV